MFFLNGYSQIQFEKNEFNQTLDNPYIVISADLDGDGNMDALVAENYVGNDNMYWYKNTDGLGSFTNQQQIASMLGSVTCMYTADLDNDGDFDILTSTWRDNLIGWYENLDGLGNFGTQNIIPWAPSQAHGGGGISAGDMDNDGDLDMIASDDGVISWYENTDGLGSFSFKQTKSATLDDTFSIIPYDMDNDGDLDILYSSINQVASSEISWVENADGLGNFTDEHNIITVTHAIFSLQIADIDNDGNIDVIAAFPQSDKIAWYKNMDSSGTSWTEFVISTEFEKPRSIEVTDIDNDGDIDVLSASYEDGFSSDFLNEFKLVWHENTDGLGNYTSNVISSSRPATNSVFASDIDNDGDIDFFATGRDYNDVYWYENNSNQLSISENTKINFKVYPNPVHKVLNIQSEAQVHNIEIYNSIGQRLLMQLNKKTFDVSELKSGIYFLKIEDNSGNFKIKKFVKE
jgi:hypothetical protein